MPTEAQLKSESCWRTQRVPFNLTILVQRLEMFYDPGVTNIGAYGDIRHLKGYHRSRRWIRDSSYCRDRKYSVTESDGNRGGGNDNDICGVDIVLGYERSRTVWERINVARNSGRISYIRELLLERDPWHVHIGLDRAHGDSDHTELFNVITGGQPTGGGRTVFSVDMPVLRNGSMGSNVITAQALLDARGFATEMDGEFGPHTEEQTRAMQARYGAEAVDGIWGPETWTIGLTGEDRL